MNATQIVAALTVLVSAGSVLAQEYVAPDAGFVSTKSRAEVVAELQQARAAGLLEISEYGYPVIQLSGTPKTRAEVVAELERARADGSLAFREDTYPVVQASGEAKTREQVRAELAQYRLAHPAGEFRTTYVGG